MFKILSKRELTQGTVYEFVLEAPKIAAKAKPGQFVVIRANESGERIPLTIANYDSAKGTISIIFQVVGKTTALLKTFEAGDAILDVMGPLGHPTEIEKYGKIVCVGGGAGIAIMYPLVGAFKKAGNHVTAILGARTKDLLFLENEIKSACDEVAVCTDDGSYGHHGLVTDVLKEILVQNEINLVFAVGPVPMMKAVSELTRGYGVKTIVSLNSIMVDGTGMCGGCRVTIGGETKFCCVDGPDFDGHQVDFDVLMQRHRAYRAFEKRAMDEHCKLLKREDGK